MLELAPASELPYSSYFMIAQIAGMTATCRQTSHPIGTVPLLLVFFVQSVLLSTLPGWRSNLHTPTDAQAGYPHIPARHPSIFSSKAHAKLPAITNPIAQPSGCSVDNHAVPFHSSPQSQHSEDHNGEPVSLHLW